MLVVTYVSMMPWVLASTRSVLGGRVGRRSLLSGTLGGRALNIDRVLLHPSGSVVIMRCEDTVASMVTMRSNTCRRRIIGIQKTKKGALKVESCAR